MKIICTTMFSPSHRDLANLTLLNLWEYCAKYGYGLHVINIENDKWAFEKHKAFRELMKTDVDVIWYKDVDSIITNMNIPITDFLDEKNSFYLTHDANELNGGSAIIKNNEMGRLFNEAILEQQGVFENEQNVYNDKIMLIPRITTIKRLPHPSINSYDYSLYPEFPELRSRADGHWHEGDFVLHVPALSIEKRLEVLKAAKITR